MVQPLPHQPPQGFRMEITILPSNDPSLIQPRMGIVEHPHDVQQQIDTVHPADLPAASANLGHMPGEVTHPDDAPQRQQGSVSHLGSAVIRSTAQTPGKPPRDGGPNTAGNEPSIPKPSAGDSGNKPPVPPGKPVPGELPEEPEKLGGYHREDFNVSAWQNFRPTPQEVSTAREILGKRVRQKINEFDVFTDRDRVSDGTTSALQLECETPNGVAYLTIFTDEQGDGSAFVGPRYFDPQIEPTDYTYSSLEGGLVRFEEPASPDARVLNPNTTTASEHERQVQEHYAVEAEFVDATESLGVGERPRVGIAETARVIRFINAAIPRRYAFADLRENSHVRITMENPVTPEDAAFGANQLDRHVRAYLGMQAEAGTAPPESKTQTIQVSEDLTMQVTAGIRTDHGLDEWVKQLTSGGEATPPDVQAPIETPYVQTSTALKPSEAQQAVLRKDLQVSGQPVPDDAEVQIVNALEYEVREGKLHVTYEGYIVANGVLARRFELETFYGDALDAGMVRNFIHNPFHTHPLASKFMKSQTEEEQQ
jgi:hypothetical protein